MRPTGNLHLGHYHGVLKNWIHLQNNYECFFFVADWHALTTNYDDPSIIQASVYDMVVDWLACGVDPQQTKLFIQSWVPEHAELHLLLSMITPLAWLERVPSFKDQQQKLNNKELSTYGFLGYPLLQSADIMIYKAEFVPVGEDQVAHVELAREIARRFNYLFGRESGFVEKTENIINKLGKKHAKTYRRLRVDYQEQGNASALQQGRDLIDSSQNIQETERADLMGYLEGTGRTLLTEPSALLTPTAKMPGIDGQKMSKSYGNTISLREDPAIVRKKLQTMPTDTARVRRTDPGDPNRCPVWQLHANYSDAETKAWVNHGCREASIGCIDCKQPIINAVLAELGPIQKRALEFSRQPDFVHTIIKEGSEAAREVAKITLKEVRQAMGLTYTESSLRKRL